jgi:hypothetical protein
MAGESTERGNVGSGKHDRSPISRREYSDERFSRKWAFSQDCGKLEKKGRPWE